MKSFVLYKVHGNDDCDKFQNIVRYLYHEGYDIRPFQIIERNFPSNIDVNQLPIINIVYKHIEGLENIVSYYEKLIGLNNLLVNANEFCTKNPDYRINDRSTHNGIKP